MIDAQRVQNRGIQIVNVDGLVDHVVAEVVGFAVDLTALDTAAGHPHRVIARMVVTTIIILCQRTLAVNRAAKFATPDHQRIVQHTSLLQILHQCRAGSIAGSSHAADRTGQTAMVVPAAQEDLRKRDTSFGHSSSQQAVVGERARLLHFRAVQVEHTLWLIGDVGQIRNRSLHPESHFVLRNS